MEERVCQQPQSERSILDGRDLAKKHNCFASSRIDAGLIRNFNTSFGTVRELPGSGRKMSRSYRKTPIFGTTTVSSERRYKATEHQRERHHVRQRLRVSVDDTDRRLHREPFGDPWAGPKDGKVYWANAARKEMRK